MTGQCAAIDSTPSLLQVYLLGTTELDAMLRLQRRIVYDVAGDRTAAALVITEHHHAITVGRTGSREHIDFEPAELATRGWPVRWVNRGGGCLLHAPGQVSAYSVMALDRFGLDVEGYLQRLSAIALNVVSGFDVSAEVKADRAGVWAQDRLLVHLGVAIRDWIGYFGMTINVGPDLNPFRQVRCSADGDEPMTSLERERRSAVRPAAVRQRLIDCFAEQFLWDRVSLFHSHPALDTVRRAPTPVLRA